MLPKISARPNTVMIERFLVSISTTAARSLMKNQCFSSSVFIGSAMNGMSMVGGVFSDGDCVGPPPGRSLKNASARKPVTPAAMMLIATPETMWSTPKTTVASACSAPARRPNAMAPTTPATNP